MNDRDLVRVAADEMSAMLDLLLSRYEPYLKETIDARLDGLIKRLVEDRTESVLGRALLDAMRVMLNENRP